LTGRTRDETRRGQDRTVAVNLRELVRTEPYLKRNFYTGPEVTANHYSTVVGHLTLVNTPNNSSGTSLCLLFDPPGSPFSSIFLLLLSLPDGRPGTLGAFTAESLKLSRGRMISHRTEVVESNAISLCRFPAI
jgi:hypothetical protein